LGDFDELKYSINCSLLNITLNTAGPLLYNWRFGSYVKVDL